MPKSLFRPPAKSSQELININLTDFSGGTDLFNEESLTAPNSAKESSNLMQVGDGRWATKWGSDYYGQALPSSTTFVGATEFVKSDGSTEIVAIGANGTAYKSTNGGSWSSISGATFTAGVKPYFLQITNKLYIANGTDNLARYDGTSLSTYTSLSTPAAPTLSRGVLTAGSYNVYYQIVATNTVGFTPAGTEATVTVNKQRSDWKTDGTEYIDLTWSSVVGATRYDIYFSDQSGYEVYLGSTSSTSFRDDGSIVPNDFVEAPVDNTTTGPKFKHMELSGNRIWGTGDPSNPHRVYWGGAGQFQGFFSPFYGGGYIDIEKGGAERPYAVVDYRDGKGTGYITVLTGDPEGGGSIWQIGLTSATVDTTSLLIPTAQRVVGSVGTDAPFAVTKVRDSIHFLNKKGVFTIGTKPQVMNVLATDEISEKIRPYIRDLKKSYVSGSCSYYFDAKVFYSIPKSGTANSHIIIFDTERRNWTVDWNIGVTSFFEYTDSTGTVHLLGVPTSGTKLVEFSQNFQGDLGSAYSTQLTLPLLPVHKDRRKWAKVRYVYYEFARPSGQINLSVDGVTKKAGYTTLATETIDATTSNAGWSSLKWSTATWSDTSLAPTTFLQASVMKRVRVNKILNRIQPKISTSTTASKYTLIGIYIVGYVIPTSDPPTWKT